MPHRAVEAIRGKADRWNLLLKHMKSFRRAFSGSNRSPDAFGKGYFSWRVGKQSECKPCDVAGAYTVRRTIHIAPVTKALFKKFCKRDFCDEVRDFKIPEPEAVAS